MALCFAFHLSIPPNQSSATSILLLNPSPKFFVPKYASLLSFQVPTSFPRWYSLCLLQPPRRLGTRIVPPLAQAVNLPIFLSFDYTWQLLVMAHYELFTGWDYAIPPLTAPPPMNSLPPPEVPLELRVSHGPGGLPPWPPSPPASPPGTSPNKLMPVFNKACFCLRTSTAAGAPASPPYSH